LQQTIQQLQLMNYREGKCYLLQNLLAKKKNYAYIVHIIVVRQKAYVNPKVVNIELHEGNSQEVSRKLH